MLLSLANPHAHLRLELSPGDGAKKGRRGEFAQARQPGFKFAELTASGFHGAFANGFRGPPLAK